MFAYCRNNPIIRLDPDGHYEVQFDFENGIIQIDLQTKREIDLMCVGKGVDVIKDIGEIGTLGFVTTVATDVPVVNAIVAYYSMSRLAHDGVEISMNISDINQLQTLYKSQGHAYLIWHFPNSFLDLLVNGPFNFSVESQPLINKGVTSNRRHSSRGPVYYSRYRITNSTRRNPRMMTK